MSPKLQRPDNFNDELQNRIIRHTLFLESLKTKQSREIVAFIEKEIIPDLIEQLTARLARIEAFGFDRGPETTARLERMIEEMQQITRRFKDINTRTQGELFDLAQDEAAWVAQMIDESVGIRIGVESVATEQLRQAVLNKPFDGRTVEQWYDQLSQSVQQRLAQEIRRGVVEGRTTSQIVNDLRKGAYLKITKRQTDAVVRSAISHVANAAREEFYNANADILQGVQWVATLDSRTCLRCAPLDGKVFDLDKGPRPPLHTNCRCTVTPVTKSWRSLGIDQDDLPPSTRASIDGQVAGDITYNQWLKKQPLEVQELALGKTKAQLFRNGGLDVKQFVNRDRVELTLEELKKREASAFRKAGLQ